MSLKSVNMGDEAKNLVHEGAMARESTSDSHSMTSFLRYNHLKFRKINSTKNLSRMHLNSHTI
jgi:hypothetical protein